jgi:hypothetical protein
VPIATFVHCHPDFMEARCCGRITATELGAAARHVVQQARSHGMCLLLSDCTDLLDGHTVIDLYDVADWLAADRTGPRFTEAIVMPISPLAAAKVRFWELACHNRGLSVRLFGRRAEALAWLFP